MPVTQRILGRQPSGTSDPDFGAVSAGIMRVGVFENPNAEHLWIKRLNIRAGKYTVTNGQLRIVAYDAEGGLNERLGYTASQSVTVLLDEDTGSGGGQTLSNIPLAVSDTGPSTKGALLAPGHDLGLGYVAITAPVSHNMAASGRPGVSGNILFFDRSSGMTPPDPYGTASGDPEGKITVWAECYTNEEPRVPVGRSILNGDTLTPTFVSDFRDRNGAWGTANDGNDCGDVVKRVRTRVYVGNASTPIWDYTYTATASERANNATSRIYSGPALSRGVEYQWDIAHQDWADAWSEFSDRLSFTIPAGGSINVTGPTGVLQALSPTVTGVWHQANGLAMKTLRARVRQGSLVIDTGDVITKTVSNGSGFSATFAQLGLDALDWNQSYTVQLMATDTSDTATSWYSGATFKTDSPPSIPTNLSPSGIITNLGIASFEMADPDDDTDSGLQGFLVIEHEPAMANASFAGGSITGWTQATPSAGITRTFAAETSVVADGDGGSAKITVSANTGGGSAYVWADDELPIVEGSVLTVRSWLRTTNTSLRHLRAIQWYDASDLLLSTSDEPNFAPGLNTWARRDYAATAPADTAYAKIGFRAFAAAGSITGTIYVDGFFPFWERKVNAEVSELTSLWEHQLDPDDMPVFGTYRLSAYGFDGTLYSGGVTSETNAVRSDVVTLEYSDGPDVTITSHTSGDVINTVRPLIEYLAPDQVRRNVEVRDMVTGALVRRSGWQVTDAHSYRPSAGYLHDGGIYRFVVYVEDINSLQGTAEVTNIQVTIERPPALDPVVAEAIYVNDEPQPSAIRVRFGQSDQDVDIWRRYFLYRSDLVDPLAEITAIGQTEFVDYLPRSRVDYTYGVSQVTEVDGTARESEIVYVTARVEFEGLVWCNAKNPTAERLMCEGWLSRGWTTDGQDASYQTWEEEAQFTVRTSAVWFNYSATVPLIDYDDILAEEQEEKLRALNRLGGVICLRDGYKRRDFVSIPRKGGISMDDGRGGRRDPTIKTVSEAYREDIGDQGDVV